MNILFIAPYVPSRIRVRPFQLIKGLARRHCVYVIALGEMGGTEPNGAEELAEMVEQFQVVPHSKLRGYWQSLMALPSRYPMCAAFCRSSAMEKAVEELMSEVSFDLMHVEHLRAAHFAPSPSSIPVLFDSVDCLTGLFRQMAGSKKNPLSKFIAMEEAWCLRWYEPRALRRLDRLIVTTAMEQRELTMLDPGLDVDVVPNGVDVEYFSPLGSRKKPGRVVFSGKMSYSPNAQAVTWFAQNVFPTLQEAVPDAEFVIVGSDPGPQVRKLAEAPGVTVTGYTSDIRPYLDSASVAVAPMQVAVGVQNKVLEAMAMALPVVATSIACRSLGSECPGVIEADAPEDVIEQVVRLINTPERAADLGQMGRKEVVAKFSWQSSVEKLEMLYEEMLAEHGFSPA